MIKETLYVDGEWLECETYPNADEAIKALMKEST